ncbi:family 1 glycosylhydrolase, partial [Enterococcus faecalis]|nr:family 1 glycosylhydrolase [Enterococcus faecalis]
ANQYEGGYQEGGRRLSSMDLIPKGKNRTMMIKGRNVQFTLNSTYDYPTHQAVDVYLHYQEDISLFVEMEFNAYRLSISWT